MIDLTTFPLSMQGWPEWLVQIMPQLWMVALVSVLAIISWFLGFLVKVAIRQIARRSYEDKARFVGTSWDLAAPLMQVLVFLVALTGVLQAFGLEVGRMLTGFWPKAMAAMIIIGGAVMLSSWANRSLRAYGERAHTGNRVDDTLINFSASMIRYAILGVAVLTALIQFGFAPGSLIAIVGAAGLAIALALQDTLKAVAAGFMLAIFRPFKIGDWVSIVGFDGEVAEITPFTTSIKQIDNKVVSFTNDRVWGEAIVNHTKMQRRRFDLYFGVHYDTDLDKALGVLNSVADDHSLILLKSDIWTGVHELGDWAITLRLRAWVRTTDFIQVRADITKAVKQRFDAENIEIPYPHQVEVFRDAEQKALRINMANPDSED